MQNQQPTQDTIQPFTFLLEFLPDQPEQSDPALIHAIGRDTVEALQHDGIMVQPVYTGQQGGDFLVEIVPTLAQFATTIWNNKAVIEEVLNDASAVLTLASFIQTIITHVKQSYEQHVGKEESVARPIQLTIALDTTRSVTIETSSVTQAQDIAQHLLHLSQMPHSHPSSSKTLKIQPKIPKKRKRRK